jgi:signal peptidase I
VKIDFALVLSALSAVTGLIWLIDVLFFAKARKARAPVPVPTTGNELPVPLVVEYARSFFPVIFAVLLVRSFLGEPFRIPSSSMMPTLLIGDFILVNKFAYGLRLPVLNAKVMEVGEPKRGDVVVFRFPGRGPTDPMKGDDFIKRVVGLPGDHIEYRGKQIFVNGEAIAQVQDGLYIGERSGRDSTGARLLDETLGTHKHRVLHRDNISRGDGAFDVPAGQYFVMGDNRDNSDDGRFWGFVPEGNLVGRAFAIWMSWDGGPVFSRIGTVVE